jgi:hypothetical protein
MTLPDGKANLVSIVTLGSSGSVSADAPDKKKMCSNNIVAKG